MVELLKQALAIYRQKARHEKVITSINTLGNLHNVLCEFEQAEKLYQEGLSVLEQFGAQIPTVSYWHGVLMGNIGLIAGRQKRYLEACQILEEVREQLVEQTDLAEVGCALAFYKAQLGKYSEAKRYRLQADELIQKLALGTPVCQEDNEWQKQNLSALCSQM
jgi:tetratricopeptide (TPR) repeat protein